MRKDGGGWEKMGGLKKHQRKRKIKIKKKFKKALKKIKEDFKKIKNKMYEYKTLYYNKQIIDLCLTKWLENL